MLDPKNVNDLKSIDKCRKISKEIVDFGVNEKEIIKIISLLSLELEDTVLMKNIHLLFNKEKEEVHEDIRKEKLII